MKQVGYVKLEEVKGDHLFTFSMPMGAPLAEASQVSYEIFKAVDKMYRDAIDKEVAAKEQELVASESDTAETTS